MPELHLTGFLFSSNRSPLCSSTETAAASKGHFSNSYSSSSLLNKSELSPLGKLDKNSSTCVRDNLLYVTHTPLEDNCLVLGTFFFRSSPLSILVQNPRLINCTWRFF